MASIDATLKQINKVLKEEVKGPYSKYSCKTVSWDDVQRGTVGNSLSCWGANITDTRLYAKDGRSLFTVRGDNWNERLGMVRADELALIASKVEGGGNAKGLQPITLRTLLTDLGAYGSYAKLPPLATTTTTTTSSSSSSSSSSFSLYEEALDEKVSVRFQTTFLPVEGEEKGKRQALEFAPEAYNYNTTRDDDPRNLILLCTSQGVALQQDGAGAKKLFHHVKDPVSGAIHRYWLEAESSSHSVGGSQKETKEEREDALQRGKATSTVIGTRAIGTRFNVLMTLQVPLKQQKIKYERKPLVYCSSIPIAQIACPPPTRKTIMFRGSGTGRSSAARVSRGSLHDTTWGGLSLSSVDKIERHPNEHITATIVMYYTCSGGVPTSDDVKRAVDDLEELYRAVEVNGNLADSNFDFMKSELTVQDLADIGKKLVTQPPPKPGAVSNADVFPL